MVIEKIDFPIYKIMIALAVIVGAAYILISLKNKKVLDKSIILFFILYFIYAIMFGKLFTFVISLGRNTSLSAYGGLIGTIIAALIYEKFYNKKGLVIKYTILALPLIYSFTKIGCFFTGCCYGIPYDGFLSIKYPHVMNEPLFPIQLLEIIIFIIMFNICNHYQSKKDITYITLTVIAITKFLVEYLRNEGSKYIISPNQGFSIILLIIVILVYLKQKKESKKS